MRTFDILTLFLFTMPILSTNASILAPSENFQRSGSGKSVRKPELTDRLLKPRAVAILDSMFADWSVLFLDSTTQRGNRVKQVKPAIYQCNLNYDTLPDFVVGFASYIDSIFTDSYVALLSDRDDFRLFVLNQELHASNDDEHLGFYVVPKGTIIPDFDVGGYRTLAVDAITFSPFSSNGDWTCAYDSSSHTFHEFVSGD